MAFRKRPPFKPTFNHSNSSIEEILLGNKIAQYINFIIGTEIEIEHYHCCQAYNYINQNFDSNDIYSQLKCRRLKDVSIFSSFNIITPNEFFQELVADKEILLSHNWEYLGIAITNTDKISSSKPVYTLILSKH